MTQATESPTHTTPWVLLGPEAWASHTADPTSTIADATKDPAAARDLDRFATTDNTDSDTVLVIDLRGSLPPNTETNAVKALARLCMDRPVVLLVDAANAPATRGWIEQGRLDGVVLAATDTDALPELVQSGHAIWQRRRRERDLQAQLRATMRALQRRNHALENQVSDLETAAGTDPLTGLINRRAFAKAIESRFAEARRYGQDLACMMIDLDGFKQLNDSVGHPVGDRILELVGRVLNANCRDMDTAGRFGGDEFVLLLPQSDERNAARIAERVRVQFEHMANAECEQHGHTGKVSMSQGLATLAGSGSLSPDDLVHHADQALYAAKAAGKHRLMIYHRQARPRDAQSTDANHGSR